MKRNQTIILLAALIIMNRLAGNNKQPRTMLGGQLENYIQYNGFGQGLTTLLREACKLVPGAYVDKDPVTKRVYVMA